MTVRSVSPCTKDCPGRYVIGVISCRSTCSLHQSYEQAKSKRYADKYQATLLYGDLINSARKNNPYSVVKSI